MPATSLLVRGARPLGEVRPASILLVDGRIAAIGEAADAAIAGDRPLLDAGGLIAAPGLVELQINGALGVDLTHEPERLWEVAAALPRHGVTSFLPTLVSPTFDTVQRARAVLAAGPPADDRGAAPLGLHVEGPFLSPGRRGAHRRTALRPPDIDATAEWSREGGVRLVTLAPELPGALELARALVARGVVVSAGHSSATLEQARAGFDAGIRCATHLFDAMPHLDHRAPGLVGAALADRRVTFSIIADGVHVDPVVVDLAWRIGGRERLALVTDATAGLGMPPGRYRLAAATVSVDEGAVRLGKRLAGSVLSLDRAVRNLAAFTGCSLDDALSAASEVPARLLGEPDRGRLVVGSRADLVLVTAAGEVVATIVGGRQIHARETSTAS